MQISLKAMRVNAGLTQKQAAEKMEISDHTLAGWEAGKNYPDAEQMIRLCRLYGCSVDDIAL